MEREVVEDVLRFVEELRRLEGGLHAPRGYSWRLGPGSRVAPTGFKPILVDE